MEGINTPWETVLWYIIGCTITNSIITSLTPLSDGTDGKHTHIHIPILNINLIIVRMITTKTVITNSNNYNHTDTKNKSEHTMSTG